MTYWKWVVLAVTLLFLLVFRDWAQKGRYQLVPIADQGPYVIDTQTGTVYSHWYTDKTGNQWNEVHPQTGVMVIRKQSGLVPIFETTG